jgi:hypothetical protein
MADINHLITLGIGTPADIPHFLLLGLSGAAPAVPEAPRTLGFYGREASLRFLPYRKGGLTLGRNRR